MRNFKSYLLLFAKGLGMGGADVVPGVSGGTIAFITGIYDELLATIKSIDGEAFSLLVRFRLRAFWTKINGGFILALLSGIIISIFSLARVIVFLLQNYPIQVWSFFYGLIIISSVVVLREVQKWNLLTIAFGIIGILSAYFITMISPSQTPEGLLFVFLAGIISICAMILPGISGSFILLILGKYEQIMKAIKDFDVLTILAFLGGCILGLLSFSRFVSWVLHKHRSATIAMLSGFMIGSLNKVWPWKETLSYRLNSEGVQVPLEEASILPHTYLEKTGNNPLVLEAILFMAVGFFLVVVLERLAIYFQSNK
jgi:putative membrane protein